MTSNEEIMAKWYRNAGEKIGQTIFQGSTINDVFELMDLAREDERNSKKPVNTAYQKGCADTKKKIRRRINILEKQKQKITAKSGKAYFEMAIHGLKEILKKLEGNKT